LNFALCANQAWIIKMYKERKPPKVWMKLGGFMHQDYGVMFPDFWSGIEEFWRSISADERDDLLEFLHYVCGCDLPGGMPKKYWALSGAQVVPSKVNQFLKELLAKLTVLPK